MVKRVALTSSRILIAAGLAAVAPSVCCATANKVSRQTEASVRTSPPNEGPCLRLGKRALAKRDWTTAIQQLERCRQESPHDSEVLFYLAQAHYQLGEVDPALSVIAQAARLAPGSAPIAQKQGEYLCDVEVNSSTGLAALLRARRLDPKLEGIDFDISMAQYRMGQFYAAKASFESELRRNPRHADAAFYLGEVFSRIGDGGNLEWEKARDCYERAIRVGGERGTYYYGLGRSMLALGDLEPAIAMLKKALQLDPGDIDAHFQLGTALRRVGREAEGLHELQLFRAARERLNVPSPLVPVRGTQGQRVWQELRALAEAGDEEGFLDRVRQLEGRGNLWLRAGAVYCVMSRPHQAMRALERARQEDPSSAEVRAWLGRVLLSEQNAVAAESEFQNALRLDGRNQTALAGLGELRYRQRRWSEAVRYLEDSQSKQPEVLIALSDAYFQLGDKENGRIAAELVRIFASDNQPVQDAVQRLLKQYQ